MLVGKEVYYISQGLINKVKIVIKRQETQLIDPKATGDPLNLHSTLSYGYKKLPDPYNDNLIGWLDSSQVFETKEELIGNLLADYAKRHPSDGDTPKDN